MASQIPWYGLYVTCENVIWDICISICRELAKILFRCSSHNIRFLMAWDSWSHASLPNSASSDFKLIGHNWLWQERLHHKNRQMLLIRTLFSRSQWLAHLPWHYWEQWRWRHGPYPQWWLWILTPFHVKHWACLLAHSCPTLCDPMTVAHQLPLSLGFARQGYWSGLPFPLMTQFIF